MKAELLFHQRIDYDDGAIVEMVLWPCSAAGATFRSWTEVFAVLRLSGRSGGGSAAKAIIGIFRAWRPLTRSPASSS
jgi:hypothetical protein